MCGNIISCRRHGIPGSQMHIDERLRSVVCEARRVKTHLWIGGCQRYCRIPARHQEGARRREPPGPPHRRRELFHLLVDRPSLDSRRGSSGARISSRSNSGSSRSGTRGNGSRGRGGSVRSGICSGLFGCCLQHHSCKLRCHNVSKRMCDVGPRGLA